VLLHDSVSNSFHCQLHDNVIKETINCLDVLYFRGTMDDTIIYCWLQHGYEPTLMIRIKVN